MKKKRGRHEEKEKIGPSEIQNSMADRFMVTQIFFSWGNDPTNHKLAIA